MRIPRHEPLVFAGILEVSANPYALKEVSEDDGCQPAE